MENLLVVSMVLMLKTIVLKIEYLPHIPQKNLVELAKNPTFGTFVNTLPQQQKLLPQDMLRWPTLLPETTARFS